MAVAHADIRDIAKAIASAIEREGHWQGPYTVDESIKFGQACCLYLNPLIIRPKCNDDLGNKVGPYFDRWDELCYAIAARLGIADPYPTKAVYMWNDMTPTAEVLDVLRSL